MKFKVGNIAKTLSVAILSYLEFLLKFSHRALRIDAELVKVTFLSNTFLKINNDFAVSAVNSTPADTFDLATSAK